MTTSIPKPHPGLPDGWRITVSGEMSFQKRLTIYLEKVEKIEETVPFLYFFRKKTGRTVPNWIRVHQLAVDADRTTYRTEAEKLLVGIAQETVLGERFIEGSAFTKEDEEWPELN